MVRVRGWLRPARGRGVDLVIQCPRCGTWHAWPWDAGLWDSRAVSAPCGLSLIVSADPRLEEHHRACAGGRLRHETQARTAL